MSTNNNEKVYVNSIYFDEKVFADGGSILKANIKADELIKFLKENKDKEGFVKLVISKKRNLEVGKSTHYATLDTWQPTRTGAPKQTPKTAPKRAEVTEQEPQEELI